MSSPHKKQQLEQQLWNIANTLRGKMDADDFRDYILGFIFYKYLSTKMDLYANEILKPDGIKYSDGTNLKAWLFTIMKNTFITQYQRMVRRNTFIDTTENLHFINSSDSLQENNAISHFIKEDINKALSLTEEIYRVPFLMYFKGFKYHEIAEELDLPIGTVKNRIHIARKTLKSSLKMYA